MTIGARLGLTGGVSAQKKFVIANEQDVRQPAVAGGESQDYWLLEIGWCKVINKAVQVAMTLCVLVAFALSLSANHANAQAKDNKSKTYTYATRGLLEFQSTVEPGKVEYWKLLLDQSNLGGKELEMVELTLPAGEVVGVHRHGSVEILYVLSGTLGHEVNGEMHVLTPGMVGVVRPEDSVRHVVPKEADVRLLVIWAPAGEAKKFFDRATTTPIEQK